MKDKKAGFIYDSLDRLILGVFIDKKQLDMAIKQLEKRNISYVVVYESLNKLINT